MSNPLDEFLTSFVTESRMETLHKVLENRTRHLTVVLENMYQTHNSSACLRSCDCFGLQDAHIIENDYEFKLNRKIAVGSARWLSLHRYRDAEQNTLECYQKLREAGYRIIATAAEANDCPLPELDLHPKTAIVFGSERHGLSPIAKSEADGFVRIPMYGFTESYNVSVACALVLSELTRRLRDSDIDWHLKESEKNELLRDWIRKSVGYRWPELEAEFFRRHPEYIDQQESWSLSPVKKAPKVD